MRLGKCVVKRSACLTKKISAFSRWWFVCSSVLNSPLLLPPLRNLLIHWIFRIVAFHSCYLMLVHLQSSALLSTLHWHSGTGSLHHSSSLVFGLVHHIVITCWIARGLLMHAQSVIALLGFSLYIASFSIAVNWHSELERLCLILHQPSYFWNYHCLFCQPRLKNVSILFLFSWI